jgi:hypothetical protein
MQRRSFLFIGIAVLAAGLIAVLAYFALGDKGPPALVSTAVPVGDKPPKEQSLRDFGWPLFNLGDENVQIRFPTPPQHRALTNTLPGTKSEADVQTYQARIKDRVYMLTVMQYPPREAMPGAGVLFQETVAQMAAAVPDAKIVEQAPAALGGRKAHDFTVQFAESPRKIFTRGRIFLIDRIRYSANVTYYDNDYDGDEFDYFVNSFAVANSPQ